MDYLNLQMTKKIFELVKNKEDSLTALGIVIRIDRLTNIKKEIHPYDLLKKLTELGFLEKNPPNNSSSAKYKLTDKSRLYLSSLEDVNRK